ncbi:amidase [Marinobacterium lutimaris]|uniref:Aspartyl-tRNA(Asn)/glutamyl-tRNA(Gln) amidotransferase subunit A n=1 Tax=Marinobacterium lutimaris TaxID=568106 RepID=A0A1H6DNT6_9GAMM|nr:amidase [Marinobacterium lutimaris]SEG86195.1 aspartyl-tRNA(Asn)/glutamyl-tRNA(Gln) amidotransferase subunit A [Marinobacterium lutimaris]
MNTPLWQLSATALVEGFKARSWTPVEALESVLARLDVVNPQLNAVVALAPDARASAEEATERYRQGVPLSDIDGVPVSIKDNLMLKGLPCVWGTRALAGNIADHDERPVARLREQGAVLFAKTNVPEFTLEGYTGNPVYGVTRNPWDLVTTPGGSSGGAVAAVAAGIGPLALCTDGGGSIRRPAAHSHLFGFKPAIGAIERGEGLPQLLLDMEVVGPVARCSEDIELLYRALTKTSAPVEKAPVVRRVLSVEQLGAHTPVDPQIRAAMEKGKALLREQGLTIVPGPLPIDLEALNHCWSQIGEIGLAQLAEKYPQWIEQASEPYRAMAERGARATAVQLWQILDLLNELREQMASIFTQWDAILTPTIAAPAWTAEQRYPETIDGQSVGPRGHAVFTGWVNAVGSASINLPLPVSYLAPRAGMQLVAPLGREDGLFSVAKRYQAQIDPPTEFEGLWLRIGEAAAS